MAWYCEDCGGRLNWPRRLGGCPGGKNACNGEARRFPRLDGFVSIAANPDEPEACDIERRAIWYNEKRRTTSGDL